MKMCVRSIEPRDRMDKVFVRVSFWDENGPPHNSAEIEVFVDHSDSLSEIRKQAIQKAHGFFKEALKSDTVETEINDWKPIKSVPAS
jgi:hypothetical protein